MTAVAVQPTRPPLPRLTAVELRKMHRHPRRLLAAVPGRAQRPRRRGPDPRRRQGRGPDVRVAVRRLHRRRLDPPADRRPAAGHERVVAAHRADHVHARARARPRRRPPSCSPGCALALVAVAICLALSAIGNLIAGGSWKLRPLAPRRGRALRAVRHARGAGARPAAHALGAGDRDLLRAADRGGHRRRGSRPGPTRPLKWSERTRPPTPARRGLIHAACSSHFAATWRTWVGLFARAWACSGDACYAALRLAAGRRQRPLASRESRKRWSSGVPVATPPRSAGSWSHELYMVTFCDAINRDHVPEGDLLYSTKWWPLERAGPGSLAVDGANYVAGAGHARRQRLGYLRPEAPGSPGRNVAVTSWPCNCGRSPLDDPRRVGVHELERLREPLVAESHHPLDHLGRRHRRKPIRLGAARIGSGRDEPQGRDGAGGDRSAPSSERRSPAYARAGAVRLRAVAGRASAALAEPSCAPRSATA